MEGEVAVEMVVTRMLCAFGKLNHSGAHQVRNCLNHHLSQRGFLTIWNDLKHKKLMIEFNVGIVMHYRN